MTTSFTRIVRLICILVTLIWTTAPSVANAQGQPGIRDATLTVKRDSNYSVPPGNVWVIVNNLNMEDGSRIELSDETSIFIIWAKNATIGNDTRVVAKGRDGTSPGDHGKNAPTVALIIENINTIKGLTISAIGGSGYDGRRGDKGVNGREASCSGEGAQDGRRGGDGGRGGNAGRGGNVFLVLPQTASGYGITTNASAGRAGSGGLGGLGGDGGRGKNKCGVWPYWKRGAGSAGSEGSRGPDGKPGRDGIFRTYTIESFEEETIADTLTGIVSVLRDEGYGRDAGALSVILGSGVLNSNQ